MNFFEMQDRARAQTRWMVFAFCVAVILTVTAINAMVLYGVSVAKANARPAVGGEAPASLSQEEYIHITLCTTAIVLLVVGAGTLYKMWQLSAGGEVVALMMGARPVDPGTTDPDERRLLNVVQEMALASGVPVPPVYIMDDEHCINAFAAGFSMDDAVIAVTRGCLNLLTRDELQGVIAHEFSHILHGDMKLNLRLMGLLYGLFVIFLVGWMIIRNIRFVDTGNKKEGGGAVLAILAFSVGLMIIGSLSWFFGQIIKAAIARQREYLADASAVQFTRFPDGIAGALKKIGGMNSAARVMMAPEAPEASHMFTVSHLGTTGSSLLATHPPLVSRIKRIDASFNGEFPKISSRDYYGGQREDVRYRYGDSSQDGGQQKSPLHAAGGISGRQIAVASAILAALDAPLKEATHNAFSAQALIYAVLLDRDVPEVRQKQMETLKNSVAPEIFAHLQKIVPLVDATDVLKLQPLVELAVPALKQMSETQYAAFRASVIQLIYADSRVDLREYALQAMLFRFLDVHYGKRPQTRTKYYGWGGPILEDVALVFSRLAWSGSEDPAEVLQAFVAATTLLGFPQMALMPQEACGLKNFDASLNRMDAVSPKLKRAFLEACFACVNADGVIVADEAQLMHAISAMLGVPTPPMEVGVKGAPPIQ